MRTLLPTACLAALMLAASDAAAQDALRTTEDKSGLWLTYTGEHSLGDRWSWMADGNIRRGEFVSEWRSLLVRSGLQWHANANVKLGTGYGFSYVYPSGPQSRSHTPEHRIYQQLVLSHAAGDVSLIHRYRFENRWLAQQDSAAGSDRTTGWLKRQRARYQVKGTLPLGSGRAYATAFDEVFVNIGANVQYNVFDQNRFAAGVGVRISPTLRVESYYMNYLVLHADGRGVDRNHVWLTVLSSSHALRR